MGLLGKVLGYYTGGILGEGGLSAGAIAGAAGGGEDDAPAGAPTAPKQDLSFMDADKASAMVDKGLVSQDTADGLMAKRQEIVANSPRNAVPEMPPPPQTMDPSMYVPPPPPMTMEPSQLQAAPMPPTMDPSGMAAMGPGQAPMVGGVAQYGPQPQEDPALLAALRGY